MKRSPLFTHTDILSPKIKRQATSTSTPLGNGTKINLVVGYGTELTYSLPIQLGDQTFNFQVDTGSGDIVSRRIGQHSYRDQ